MKRAESVKKEAILIPPSNGKKSVVKITFPFEYDTLNQIRGLYGRRYFGDEWPKYWTAPLNLDTVQSLKGWGFQLSKELHEFLIKNDIDIYKMEEMEVPGLKGELYPFQKIGVSFIEARDGRAVVGDHMGLGKTVQALAWLQLHPELRPAVVICPATGKFVWEDMANDWLPYPKIQVIPSHEDQFITGEIIILNYDILPNRTEPILNEQGKPTGKRRPIPGSGWIDRLMKQIRPEVLILDECHYVKNNQAARTKAVKRLGKQIPHVMAMSGTPLKSRPIELYNALKLVDSTVVPDFWDYVQRYCNAFHTPYGWDYSGASNTQELHERLTSTIMIRRTKEEVLPELPPKTRSIIPVELTNQAEYNRAEKNFITWVKENRGADAAKKASNAEALVKTEVLKQIAVKGKLKAAVSWIKDFLDINGKLVVFATHKTVIAALMEEFGEIAVKLDGSTSQKNRAEAVRLFQNEDKIRLFVGNMQAAGQVITLHAASDTCFLELGWTPGDHDQAEDRVHRIGQEADNVGAHYLLARNSIEEEIAELLDEKRKVVDSVLDGKETKDESLLTELLKKYGGGE